MSENQITPPPLPKKDKPTPPPIPKKNNATPPDIPKQPKSETPKEEKIVQETPELPPKTRQAEQPQTTISEPEKSGKNIGLIIGILVLLFMIVGAVIVAVKLLPKFSQIVSDKNNPPIEQQNTENTENTETPTDVVIQETDSVSQETEQTPSLDNNLKIGQTPFTTTVLLNIRQCAEVSCQSLGVIPKSSTVYPLLNDDGKWSYQSDSDTTGWIQFHYQGKLCSPENYNKDKGECSLWEDNKTAQGWLHSSGVIFNINVNELVNLKDSRSLATIKDTNIRQCASTSCEVLGVMPKETPMNILFIDNETPAAWNNWFAVEYQGKFCYPNDFNQKTGCLKWTEKQKVRGFIHRSTINFEFNENQQKQPENNENNNNIGNLF